MHSSMKINDFDIPLELENFFASGSKLPSGAIDKLEAALTCIECPISKLFSKEEIIVANKLWSSEYAQHYFGTSNEENYPGNIDPKLTLIIGQAEPDSPIALDYRVTPPRVVYFGDVEKRTYWLVLADSFNDFASILGI